MNIRFQKGDIKLILGLIILFGGLTSLYFYSSYLKSLPSRYTISTSYWTKYTGKGEVIFFTYKVNGIEYKASHDAPNHEICNSCRYVVEFKVGKIDYGGLHTEMPIPDSIDLEPPQDGWSDLPVERDGAEVVVKEEYKSYIKK